MGGDFPVPYIHILWNNLNKTWAGLLFGDGGEEGGARVLGII